MNNLVYLLGGNDEDNETTTDLPDQSESGMETWHWVAIVVAIIIIILVILWLTGVFNKSKSTEPTTTAPTTTAPTTTAPTTTAPTTTAPTTTA
jgi:hypothetical protein